MHSQYRMNQYVVKLVDNAIEKGYVKTYFQPVVSSKNKKICGFEALARWIDPKYGFLSPAKFVPALEAAHLIYKLDMTMLINSCKFIQNNIKNGRDKLSISINFSRMDFIATDIVSKIEEVVQKYKTPKDLLHIEITESALTDNFDKLQKDVARLHELGYKVWLDDFGSGYSSFNTLKDFDFDLVKLDMLFLSSFNENPKSKVIINSVVKMAQNIGLGTLCEGVETIEQADFLSSIGVERLQGYLYGKPEDEEAIINKINKKEYKTI